MDKKKAIEFVEEIKKLQEKYGFFISSNYTEEIDRDYDGDSFVSGVSSHLTVVDKEGFEISIDDLFSGYSTCFYCGRSIESEISFCHIGCLNKYKEYKSK